MEHPLVPADLGDYLAQPSVAEDELLRLFNPGEPLVIFDIGSCEGEDSVRYARRFPRARIFAFEPLPANQVLARANFAKFGITNAELVPLGLSDRSGPAPFHVSSGRPKDEYAGKHWNYGNKSSSLLAPANPGPMFGWVDFKEQITIETTTLELFCQARGIERIDFIHMDVQGAEHLVLRGAGSMLAHTAAIWLEVSDEVLYSGQKVRSEIEALMRDHDFELALHVRRSCDGDQLYLRRNSWRTARYFLRRCMSSLGRRPRRIAAKARMRFGLALDCLRGVDDDYGRTRVKPSFAQAGEDVIAWRALAAVGIIRPCYLDIGAHHPEHLSNTALFHKLGAAGMNIEPDPRFFAAFPRARPRDINLNIGIGSQAGDLVYYRMREPSLNTFSEAEANRISSELGVPILDTLSLPVRRITDVLNEHGIRPDFVSIDTEGTELDILQTYDFEAHRPAVICAETLHFGGNRNIALIDFLIAQDFRVEADTTINTLFVDARRSRSA